MRPFYAENRHQRDDFFEDTKPFFLFNYGNDQEVSLFVEKEQWRINEQYLYTSTLDHQPGDQNAVAASNGYWQIVKPQSPPFYGEVLNLDDPRIIPGAERNLMLNLRDFAQLKVNGPPYVFDRSKTDLGECKDLCSKAFVPFLFSSLTNPALGPWRKVRLKSNSSNELQWAYEGRLIYLPKDKKNDLETFEIAKKYGLTPIVQPSCYAGNTQCLEALKDRLDEEYWSPQ
jgi:predicted lipoprotein with Yx(FWY)xxD motif